MTNVIDRVTSGLAGAKPWLTAGDRGSNNGLNKPVPRPMPPPVARRRLSWSCLSRVELCLRATWPTAILREFACGKNSEMGDALGAVGVALQAEPVNLVLRRKRTATAAPNVTDHIRTTHLKCAVLMPANPDLHCQCQTSGNNRHLLLSRLPKGQQVWSDRVSCDDELQGTGQFCTMFGCSVLATCIVPTPGTTTHHAVVHSPHTFCIKPIQAPWSLHKHFDACSLRVR
jgi:hypothetical protein